MTTPPGLLRRLRPLGWFILALIVIDVIVRLTHDTWERHSPDDYAERIDGCRARPRDFVLAGGSPVSEGLDPDLIAGVRWRGQELHDGYSIGLPGGTATDFYHAVTHACPTPPKLLVYGIACSDLNDSRNEPHGSSSLMTWADLSDCVETRPENAEWTIRTFLEGRLARSWAAYRYRHGMRMTAALVADAIVPGCCPVATSEARQNRNYSDALRTGRGYAPAEWFVDRHYDVIKATNAPQAPFPFLNRYKTGSHLKYLDKLLAWVAERDIGFVLVDMPTTVDLETQFPAVVAEYRERLTEFERKHNLHILRATREAVGLTDADFADRIHLNRDGARKLSLWVRARLAERLP